jgi:hypothetical protein
MDHGALIARGFAMARPWRWISTDIGIAADLSSRRDFAGEGFRQPATEFAAPKGPQNQRTLFCEWVQQRCGRRIRWD